MGCLGNCIWFLCGGIVCGFSWIMSGVACCCTIVGIPVGIQCFKFATMAFFPFGKEIKYGGGTPSLLANIIWVIFLGIPMAIEHACFGILCYITIIGIPFGKQFMKLAKLSLMPFGAEIV